MHESRRKKYCRKNLYISEILMFSFLFGFNFYLNYFIYLYTDLSLTILAFALNEDSFFPISKVIFKKETRFVISNES